MYATTTTTKSLNTYKSNAIKCKYEILEIKGENQQLQAPTKFTEATQPLGKSVKFARERGRDENRYKKN